MKPIALLAALLLSLSGAAVADDCEYTEPRTASVDAAGATLVRVESGAGWLVVEGRPGLSSVEVDGVACAESARDLERIELVAQRRGNEVIVEAKIAETMFDWSNGRLDMTVLVPEGIAADIKDGSGELEVSGVGDLDLHDGSGELDLRSIHGDVTIVDGSGEMELEDVEGRVEITDGSGEIEIRGAAAVEIRDGSGDISVSDVVGDFIVDSDGSGDIDANGIGGDFVVESDGSGSIRHDRVEGRVDVPRD